MKYLDYTVEDFVLDKEFREWVIRPNKELNLHWQNWLDKHPEKQEVVRQAVEIILHLPTRRYRITGNEIEEISRKLEESITAYEDSSTPSKTATIPLNARVVSQNNRMYRPSKNYRGWLAIAATVTLVAAVAYYFLTFQNTVPPANSVQKVELTTRENPKGMKSSLVLSDGSRVVLNAGSKISFPHPLGETYREVHLEGEAFFDVKKDPSRPFRVFTGGMVTTVLGTSFNVKAYPQDGEVKVALATGRVIIDNLDKVVGTQVLRPGEELVYVKAKDTFHKTTFDAKEVLSWKDNILFFKNADEPTVISRLENWYGVDIRVVNKSAKRWSINAEFDDRSLEHVLHTLGYTMAFDFKISGQQVTIEYRDANS